jgi:hypothetical protein
LADFQLVILFKIVRREDRDNIRIIWYHANVKCEDIYAGYTPHKRIELDYKMCEDIYDSNPLIPTSCVVSQSVQVSKETEKELIS